jgi:hypothetical protein
MPKKPALKHSKRGDSTSSPFQEALLALRLVSLRVEHLNSETEENPYRCPLSTDRQAEAAYDQIAERLESITSDISKKLQAIGIALVRVDETLSPVEILARHKAQKEREAKAGVPGLIEQRQRIIDSFYDRHAKSLAAISDRFSPSAGVRGIAQSEVKDLAKRRNLKALEERVTALAKAIEGAERTSYSDHRPARIVDSAATASFEPRKSSALVRNSFSTKSWTQLLLIVEKEFGGVSETWLKRACDHKKPESKDKLLATVKAKRKNAPLTLPN